mmetsp:Transcript_10527/g.17190  ORF Transcript_10527/g.17190 Transcript_10527/m.17190 type:complete len:531 (-) Transcript_10527:103-1695(-)
MRAKGVLDRKYIFEYEVGQFHFGTCQVLRDRESNDPRNCKVVPKSILRNPSGVLERLNGLKGLQGTHIAAVLDVLEDAEKFYIISEFGAGGDVGDWMDRLNEDHLLEEGACAAYVRQALLALSQAQSRGLFHHDLQPQNLLLTSKMPDAVVKVNDIGLAGILDPDGSILQRQAQHCAYAAPEVRDRASPPDGASDMWSMGAIAHQLLVGQTPSASSSGGAMEWLSRLGGGRHEDLWAERSLEARDFVDALMESSPDQRVTAARALQLPWLKSLAPAQAGQSRGDSAQRTLCYMLATLLIPVLVPYRDFEQLRTAFLKQDTDADGYNTERVVQRILSSRCSLSEAVRHALAIVDISGTGSLDLCSTACADLIAREFFAAGPTSEPLSGPFDARSLCSRMVKRFFEAFGEKKQPAGSVAVLTSESIGSRLRTSTAQDMERYAGVSYSEMLEWFPEDRVIDAQALTQVLSESNGQGTPIGFGEYPDREQSVGYGNLNIGFMDFFQTCGVGNKRDESPHSFGVSSRVSRHSECA